jgi:hypothetical protein
LAVKQTAASEFKNHFKENYEQRTKTALKWNSLSTELAKWFFVIISLYIVVTFFFSFLKLTEIEITIVIGIGIVSFFGLLGLVFFSSWKASSQKVERKEILAYYLLEAARHYDAFIAEGKNKPDFLDTCLVQLREFGRTLRDVLDNSQMPLKLPDLAQLEALYDNIMNRIYPAIKARKDYPATAEGRNFGDVLVSLAEFFFSEKEYDDLPSINQGISTELSDIYVPYAPIRAQRVAWLKDIARNFAFIAVVSFPIIIGVALLLVLIFRFQYGVESFWDYVAANAATISLGILAAWASVVVVLRSASKTKE